jgi:hypothetical protein
MKSEIAKKRAPASEGGPYGRHGLLQRILPWRMVKETLERAVVSWAGSELKMTRSASVPFAMRLVSAYVKRVLGKRKRGTMYRAPTGCATNRADGSLAVTEEGYVDVGA